MHGSTAGSEGAARYNIGMTRKTRIQPIESAEPEVDENGYDRPSKSQLKRDMHELQELGSALIALPKDALKRMPMPEKLDDAVREARRITDHEGKRRQVQYVGRVMRSLLDEETAALRTALDTYNGVNKAETAKLHWIERTREKLLANDAALNRFHPPAPECRSATGPHADPKRPQGSGAKQAAALLPRTVPVDQKRRRPVCRHRFRRARRSGRRR